MACVVPGTSGQDRQPNNKRYELRVTGHTVEISVEQYGSTQKLIREVVGTTALTLSFDEMKYNPDTGEIEPRGNVRVKLHK